MSIAAIALLLTSAVLHALWNLILKQSPIKYIAMGWQNILSGIFAIIILFFTGLPPQSMWLLVALSALLESIYFGLLTFAYHDHDFSLVYPVARGAAPALVLVWSAIFLAEIPSTGGFVGILLIIVGLVIIGMTSLPASGPSGEGATSDRRLSRGQAAAGPAHKVVGVLPTIADPGGIGPQDNAAQPKFRGILIALTVALVISIYTIVDGFAVRRGPALPYGLALFALMPLFSTPFLLRHYGWNEMIAGFRSSWKRLLLVGIIALVAYVTVVVVYSFAPVNYSEAIREVSVVLGAFLGWQFLGEEMGKVRVVGAVAIFLGIALIAILG